MTVCCKRTPDPLSELDWYYACQNLNGFLIYVMGSMYVRPSGNPTGRALSFTQVERE